MKELRILRNEVLFLKNGYIEKMADLADEVWEKNKIEIVFAGKLSTGKTTILNNILGKALMPTGIGTTTKTINRVSQGKTDKIEVITNDNKVIEYELNKENLDKINESSGIKSVNLYLKDFEFEDIELVDIPGIDEIKEDIENITLSSIPSADAVVFVMDVSKGLTEKDKDFFDNFIIKFFRDKIFIVFNKIDMVEDEITEEDLRKIKEPLKDYSVYFISAKNMNEGFLKFKEDLFTYIKNTDKSIVKRNRVLTLIDNIALLSNNYINSLIENSTKTKEQLEEEFKQLKEQEKEIEKKMEEIKQKADAQLNQLKSSIHQLIDKTSNFVKYQISKFDDLKTIKDYLDQDFRRKLQELVYNIKTLTQEKLKDISIPEQDSFIGQTYEIIFSARDFIGKIQSFLSILTEGAFESIVKIKPISELKESGKLDGIGKIISVVGTLASVAEQYLEQKLDEKTKDDISERIDSFFDKMKNNIDIQLERLKDEYIQDIKNLEYGDLDSKKITIEKNIEYKSMEKSDIEKDIEFYKDKVNTINNLVNTIKEKIGG